MLQVNLTDLKQISRQNNSCVRTFETLLVTGWS